MISDGQSASELQNANLLRGQGADVVGKNDTSEFGLITFDNTNKSGEDHGLAQTASYKKQKVFRNKSHSKARRTSSTPPKRQAKGKLQTQRLPLNVLHDISGVSALVDDELDEQLKKDKTQHFTQMMKLGTKQELEGRQARQMERKMAEGQRAGEPMSFELMNQGNEDAREEVTKPRKSILDKIKSKKSKLDKSMNDTSKSLKFDK